MDLVSMAGNILDSKAELLVNPSNFQGPMYGGLARQFADRFPGLEEDYCAVASSRRMNFFLCNYHYFHIWRVADGRRVISFPTMNLGEPANLAKVTVGLRNLALWVMTQDYVSIAIPKIGCGIGGLDWADVRKAVIEAFNGVDITVELYEGENEAND